MKSQRIPEHKLNVTHTVGQALENMVNNVSSNIIDKEKTQFTTSQVHSNEVK
ncbi:hypothetical protein BAOM_1253 [Peribacillus asahii]|uniref:Uncharacterized protein n=1 Tax=Peribacillus asahii TaxID=228899 RepID=A0A3Q9RL91_9BACI|nr:hypothetical protein [Peribacillus asahii]AZV41863.1 hypothetical protein BAOM_1253 [Peribacillus asahii]